MGGTVLAAGGGVAVSCGTGFQRSLGIPRPVLGSWRPHAWPGVSTCALGHASPPLVAHTSLWVGEPSSPRGEATVQSG